MVASVFTATDYFALPSSALLNVRDPSMALHPWRHNSWRAPSVMRPALEVLPLAVSAG